MLENFVNFYIQFLKIQQFTRYLTSRYDRCKIIVYVS